MRNVKSELKTELRDLNTKLHNLEAFLGGKVWDTLPQVQKSLLIVQKDAMSTYATCLYERINSL